MNWMGDCNCNAQWGAFSVVPEQPIHELVVEFDQIGKEQVLVVVEELLLHGAVEALAVGVHLRGLREGVPVRQGLRLEHRLEVLHELTAVVGQHELDRAREDGSSPVIWMHVIDSA